MEFLINNWFEIIIILFLCFFFYAVLIFYHEFQVFKIASLIKFDEIHDDLKNMFIEKRHMEDYLGALVIMRSILGRLEVRFNAEDSDEMEELKRQRRRAKRKKKADEGE
jgi:hypothetical protein